MKLIEAFAAAIIGRQKSLSIEHFRGDAAEVTKIKDGERRPTFEILEAAFKASPEPLYEWVRATFPVRLELLERPWEETLARAGRQLELFTDAAEKLAGEIHAVREQREQHEARERKGPIRVEPRAGERRRRA